MMSNVGIFLLYLSLFFSVAQIFVSSKNAIIKLKKLNYIINGLLISSLLSFFFLIYLHIISDFSILNVFQNSHTTKPLIYKISGVWGNHEGSLLLWILVLTVFNYFIYKIYNKKNSIFVLKTLQTQGIITSGFILFTILTSNPFEKIVLPQEDGLGFNPILQDPALAIHPPLLYIGYVGFSAAFSMSVATLSTLKSTDTIPWYTYMKPFVMAAWSFLTLGIALGSIWAYYELGWGGWWFWDPVENASFMPWLLGTALLHSLIIVEKRKSLQSWVLFLSIMTFLLSIIGTFLVRSGILTSVHTFALDPSRGIYILTFIAILGAYSLVLFGLKSRKFLDNNYFTLFSREGSILINNIFMVIICSTVFLGTIYPLLIEALTTDKISVGEPYYNSTVIPITIPAILVMGFAPFISWIKIDKQKFFKKIFPNILVVMTLTILFFLFYKSFNLTGMFGIILSFWLIYNNLSIFYNKRVTHSYSMILAHLGVGFLILGITSSSIWQTEKILKMSINNEVQLNQYNIIFKKVTEVRGPNYLAIQGVFEVYDNKKNMVAILRPENRFYPITNIFTTEASIHTNLLRDLYIVIGEGNKNEGWVVRFYHNPLVIWIWIGTLFIFLGGIISMLNNIKKIKILQL